MVSPAKSTRWPGRNPPWHTSPFRSRPPESPPQTMSAAPADIAAMALLIVDDEVLRIGSANMNNRSMGLDTEADLFIDARRPANDRAEVREAIRQLRYR